MTYLGESSSKSGFWLTLISFIKSQIGAGLFAMGDAFRNSGLVAGCFLTLILGVLSTYGNHIILNSSDEVKKRRKLVDDPSFPEIVGLCFDTGPKHFRRWCTVVRRTVKAFIILTQLGFCSVYFVFAAQTAQTISEKCGVILSTRICIAIVYPIVVASCMIRTIKLLTPLSMMSNILLITGIIFTVAISAMNLPSPSERRLISPLSKWPLFFATTIYSFEGISLVIPIRNEMKDPKKFSKPLGVLNITMGITIFILLSVGFIGYLRYGDDVQGSLTLNLPDNQLSQAVQVMVALGVLFTYPLQFFIASDLVWKDVKDLGPIKHPKILFAAIKVALVTLTACLAAIVPHLSLFISLVGAISSTSLAFVIPPICDIALRSTQDWPKKEMRHKIIRYTLDALLLVVAAIGFFLGTYCSLTEIIAAFLSGED